MTHDNFSGALLSIWGVPSMGDTRIDGWFIMIIEMGDLGLPLF